MCVHFCRDVHSNGSDCRRHSCHSLHSTQLKTYSRLLCWSTWPSSLWKQSFHSAEFCRCSIFQPVDKLRHKDTWSEPLSRCARGQASSLSVRVWYSGGRILWQWSFRKTGAVGTLASQADIGVWVQAPGHFCGGRGGIRPWKFGDCICKILQSCGVLKHFEQWEGMAFSLEMTAGLCPS